MGQRSDLPSWIDPYKGVFSSAAREEETVQNSRLCLADTLACFCVTCLSVEPSLSLRTLEIGLVWHPTVHVSVRKPRYPLPSPLLPREPQVFPPPQSFPPPSSECLHLNTNFKLHPLLPPRTGSVIRDVCVPVLSPHLPYSSKQANLNTANVLGPLSQRGDWGQANSGNQTAASSSFWGQVEAPTGVLWCFEAEPRKPRLVRMVDQA